MARETSRLWPAVALATAALVAALGGTVDAATRIDGHTIRVKSLPGNRLAPRSVPANRLRLGAIPGNRLAPGSVTGRQIDAATLAEVPEAARARAADSAHRADTATVADSADEAQRLNGHVAACDAGTRAFAGSCWEIAFATTAVTAPEAAVACARRGGELPTPLALVAFASETGVPLASGGEWTGQIATFVSRDVYTVITVLADTQIEAAPPTDTKRFRCVIPLVS